MQSVSVFTARATLGRNRAAKRPPKFYWRSKSAAPVDLLVGLLELILLANSTPLADAICASLCFARRRARFAKSALHPALYLTTAGRSADVGHRARRNRTGR